MLRTFLSQPVIVGLAVVFGSCFGQIVAGPRRVETAVVGVDGPVELYPDAKLKKSVDEKSVKLATELTVLETRADAVRVKTPSGDEGWLRRCWLCSAAELKRRKETKQIPQKVVCIGSKDGESFLYGGALSIRNNQVVMLPGDAFWLDATMKGKEFGFGGKKVSGDPNVALLAPPEGDEMIRLTIWPFQEPKKDQAKESPKSDKTDPNK